MLMQVSKTESDIWLEVKYLLKNNSTNLKKNSDSLWTLYQKKEKLQVYKRSELLFCFGFFFEIEGSGRMIFILSCSEERAWESMSDLIFPKKEFKSC